MSVKTDKSVGQEVHHYGILKACYLYQSIINGVIK